MASPLLKRVLRQGSKGQDVKALKRALISAGFRKKKLGSNTTFGPLCTDNVKAFQKAHNLQVDGVFGQKTFNALWPHYDLYGRFLIGLYKPPVVKTTRQKIVDAAFLGYRNRDAIHYTQGPQRWSGIDNHLLPPHFPTEADCSSFATWCYWTVLGHGPDMVNNTGWGWGFTGTMITNGHEISVVDARPGDLFFYGSSHNAISHVAIYVGNGRVVSHGSEAGPSLEDWPLGVGFFQQARSYLP